MSKMTASYTKMLALLGGSNRHQGIVTHIEEQSDFGILRPKGPKPEMVRQFDKFLRLLAISLGVSEQTLRKRGYRCEHNGYDAPKLSIPNAEHRKKFLQFRQGHSPVHLFPDAFRPNKNKPYHMPPSPWDAPRPRR